MKNKSLLSGLILLVFLSVPVFAQLEGNPENWCRNGAFPRESRDYFLATVKGKKGDKIFFFADDENCPNGKNCRLKSYLIPNDEVIVSRKFAGFACAWFQPKKGAETVGWLPLDKLEFVNMVQGIGENDWTGTWTYADSEIKIAPTGKENIYKVTGNAFWKGLGDNIHIGELDGEAKLVETNLKYGENTDSKYDCKVTMQLIDRYMIVSDNLNCGGLNVTFSGVYQRTKRTK